MEKIKVFIDTNVWFSFFYGSENAEKIIKAHINNKIQAVISKDVLDELVKNILSKIPDLEENLLTFFKSSPPAIVKSPVKINSEVKRLVQLKDRHVFQSCLNSKCNYFITGNLKDFKVYEIKNKFGVIILSPNETVKYLKL